MNKMHGSANEERYTDPPIACSLTAPELRNRRESILKEFKQQIIETKELPDGYAFCFAGEPSELQWLAEFMAFERECCAFLTFVLEAQPNQGAIWLSLTGPQNTKEFLQKELL